jgi:excinuclease ABC subunit A
LRGKNRSLVTGHRSLSWASRRTSDASASLVLRGAREHNLRHIDVTFPLGKLVVVTGVSGSGKSTLVNDILAPATRRALGRATETCGAFDSLSGMEALSDVVVVDQSPIGKSSRSNPASYVGAFDAIRKVFARLPKAKELGFGVSDFSYNSGRGRCPSCAGTGFEMVEMQYLSDVYLRCEDCGGRRYKGEILDVTYPWGDRALSIADTLDITVDDALDAFADEEPVVAALRPLADVGLGYLRLGQPVPTLSGGETQRLKLAGALAEATGGAGPSTARKIFLLDEPTTGLHHTDIDVLLAVLRRLVDAGHSVVVIEHNLQFIAASDWVVDMGPEGGDAGGRIVAEGTPADVARGDTHTGRALAGTIGASRNTPPCPSGASPLSEGGKPSGFHRTARIQHGHPKD